MNRFRKQFDVQNVLKIIQGDDSEYEGCDSDSEEDIDDPDYTPAKKDMEDDESSGSDSDISGSSDLDLEAARPNTNSGEQNTTSQGKKTFSWRKKHFETPECTFKGPSVAPPDNLQTPLEYFRKFITSEMLELLKEQTNLYSVQKSGTQKNVNTTVKNVIALCACSTYWPPVWGSYLFFLIYSVCTFSSCEKNNLKINFWL